MTDVALRESLSTVQGDAPSPEFLASLSARLEAESEATELDDDDLPFYLPPVVGEVVASERRTVAHQGGRRRWVTTGIVAAAAAVAIVVGLVALSPGEDGSNVTTRLPHGFVPSVLPAAIIQNGDGDVVLAAQPTADLDEIVPSWYDERSTIDDLGVVGGLSMQFDLDVPFEADDCRSFRQAIRTQAGIRYLPCGGSSAALLFADDAAAVDALDAVVAHLDAHSAGTYALGVVLERVRDLEANLGDEAEAFVLEQYVDSSEDRQVVVIAWRTDNLVQFVWDINDIAAQTHAELLMDVAERIEQRTAEQRHSGATDRGVPRHRRHQRLDLRRPSSLEVKRVWRRRIACSQAIFGADLRPTGRDPPTCARVAPMISITTLRTLIFATAL